MKVCVGYLSILVLVHCLQGQLHQLLFITASLLYYSFTWPFTFTPSMSSLWLPTRQFFRRISISSLKAWMYYIFLFHTKYINSRLLKEGAVNFTANLKPAKQEMLLIKTWWWIPSLRDHIQRSKSWSDPLWKEIKMHVPQFLGYIGQSLKSKHMSFWNLEPLRRSWNPFIHSSMSMSVNVCQCLSMSVNVWRMSGSWEPGTLEKKLKPINPLFYVNVIVPLNL